MRSPKALLVAMTTWLALSCAEPDPCADGGCCESSLECPGGQTCDAAGHCALAQLCGARARCQREDVCGPNRWCDSPPRGDPERAVIFGAVNGDPPLLGFAHLDQPSRLIGGVWNSGDVVLHWAKLDGLGQVVYLETLITYVNGSPVLVRNVRRLVPDPWLWELEQWVLRGALRANDPEIPAPCDPTEFVGRPGTDEITFGCPDGHTYGPDGTLLVEDAVPVAVNVDGAVLVRRGAALLVRSPGGELSGPVERAEIGEILSARARGAGFWVVAWDPAQRRARRWTVDPTGAAGDGAVYPGRTCGECLEHALDAEGAVYRAFAGLDDRNQLVSGIERCLPSGCARVYLPERAPKDVESVPPVRYVYPMPPRACAITGP